MKKLLSTLAAVMLAITAFAQTTGDKITIYKTDGTTQEYNLTGTNNALSSLKHTADGKMQVYIKGLEALGAWETYDVNNINNITWSIYHASDVSDISLADASATDATKRLYKYLKLVYGTKTLSSVMADVNWNHKLADNIYQKTGKYPAINCYDFIQIYVPGQKAGNWINYNDITPVTEWADAGGIVNLMWHFNVPKSESTTIGNDGSGVTCTPSETTFKATNALTQGTWENKWFYAQMDSVCKVLLKLQEAGVVAMWRPFHEAAGNATRTKGDWTGSAWFWWGEDGAETYKSLWQTMFNYFQSKGVHNLIWEWTSQNYNGDSTAYSNDDSWYPGDKYVDIIGRDLYGYTAAQQTTEYKELQSRYPAKMVTLSECGTESTSNTATADVQDAWNAGAKWLNFMPWYGSNMPSDAWWTKVMSEDAVITRDEVNTNATAIEETATQSVANMGLGFDLGNTLEAWNASLGTDASVSSYETCWGQAVTTKSSVDFLKNGGFNAVRLPVTWFQHLDADGNVKKEWMDRVQEVVDYIISNGMYCILNVHHDTGSGDASTQWIKADADNYTANQAKYEKLWTQIATRFQDYSQRLLFEGYNEMLDASNTWNAPLSTSGYTAINNYAQSFVNAVRNSGGNNATRNLIVSTYAASCGEDAITHLQLPTDKVSNHLAVEVHTYSPYNWFSTYGVWNSTCSNEIKSMFSLLNTNFVSKGIPAIIGEYGTHGKTSVSKTSTATQIQAAADQAADMVSQAKALGIATYYWMSIYDGTDRSVPQWTLPTVVTAMKNAYNK